MSDLDAPRRALKSCLTYTSNAAIRFVPISGSSLCGRSILYILYIIKSSTNATVAYGQLTQQ